jgi:hypothetical protein
MGKYEPLRKCLADQVPQIGELAMTFTEIERLVGPLPRSARSHQSWWSNGSETRTHTRAWRQAGWRVQADQAKQRVVFTRDTRTAVVTRPAETSSREEQLLRWGVICGLTVAAAVAAGISGVVGVTHLPLPALAILSAAAGGVSFTAGQAIAFHEEVGSARNWWFTSTLLLLLTFIGAFAYHLSFDPAMRAPLAYQFFVNGDETDVIPLYGEPGGPAQLLATGTAGQDGLIGGQTYAVEPGGALPCPLQPAPTTATAVTDATVMARRSRLDRYPADSAHCSNLPTKLPMLSPRHPVAAHATG